MNASHALHESCACIYRLASFTFKIFHSTEFSILLKPLRCNAVFFSPVIGSPILSWYLSHGIHVVDDAMPSEICQSRVF